jgi:uncharacterized membrane protein HdeD (DUF308 family)
MKDLLKGVVGIPVFAIIALTTPIWGLSFVLWMLGLWTYRDIERWLRNWRSQ